MNKNTLRLLMPFVLPFLLIPVTANAQTQTQSPVSVGKDLKLTIGGFLRIDGMFDSRQTSEAAEGLFTFFPLAPSYDAQGKDLNATPKMGYSSIATRLTTRFFGPDALNAKTQAYVEFDFTSVLSGTTGVRLRQAYLQFDWEKTRLLAGQTWHPLSSNLIPSVIGLNTGAPFWFFSRSPQLRLEYKTGKFLLALTGVYQADYASPGPLATVKSSDYQRNAIIPEIVASVRYGNKFQIGLAGETKTIKPRNYTTNSSLQKFQTTEKLTTFVGQGWMSYTHGKLQLKGETLYGQNTYEAFMLGGYGIHSLDTETGRETYTPTQHWVNWVNITYGSTWRAGLFAGYIKNLGTTKIVPGGASGFFGREPGIKQMIRIAPHILYTVNNFQFGAEAEITAASFGTVLANTKGSVANAKFVTNSRLQLTMSYLF